jgi:hypothetical protein
VNGLGGGIKNFCWQRFLGNEARGEASNKFDGGESGRAATLSRLTVCRAPAQASQTLLFSSPETTRREASKFTKD